MPFVSKNGTDGIFVLIIQKKRIDRKERDYTLILG